MAEHSVGARSKREVLLRWIGSHRAAAWVIGSIGGGLLLLVALFGIATATDQPGFCRSACHEMAPYHEAWATSPHKDVGCVDCHVDAGGIARLEHKFVAIREVQAHLAGDIKFPRPEFAVVPNARCVRCHETIKETVPGFNHAEHTGRGPCMSCHPGVGHSVAVEALQKAGVYSGKPSAVASLEASQVAAPGAGLANLVGHASVSCTRCHDMAKTGCTPCHQPAPHVARGDCDLCHLPGAAFAFTHPSARQDCGAVGCHIIPAKHNHPGVCGACHSYPGASWRYAHSAKSKCESCHKRPAKHRSGACNRCHKKFGVSWAFSHPSARSKCVSCHPRPSGHRSGSCSVCHKPGASWAFRHPGSSSCSQCHLRPGGHRSGGCTTCHRRRGVSWSFSHPSSSRCGSCHRAPSNHFGSNCSACHSPGRSWGSATFRHGSISGGEHTYRSFGCSNCHPRGYSSHTCSKCHDSASGPRDD